MIKDKSSCLSRLNEVDSRINRVKHELRSVSAIGGDIDRQERLSKRFERLERERSRIMINFDQNLRTYIERLANRYDQSGVVMIRDSHCSGCHVKLPTRDVIQLNTPEAFVICSFCGRIILPSRSRECAEKK